MLEGECFSDKVFPSYFAAFLEDIIIYCCPVKPGFRDFSSRNPSKYGT